MGRHTKLVAYVRFDPKLVSSYRLASGRCRWQGISKQNSPTLSYLCRHVKLVKMQQNLKEIFGNTHGLDEKSIESLTIALEKNNLPGFDYLEFKVSLGRLAQMGMPEETAYKSAYATASTVGLTKEKLISTALHYKKVLTDEKAQFDQALENQLQRRVNNKRQEVEKLKAQIQAWKEQISNLEQQILKSQSTIDDADNQIQLEMRKIQATQENFEHTHQSVMNQIELDLQNIQRLL